MVISCKGLVSSNKDLIIYSNGSPGSIISASSVNSTNGCSIPDIWSVGS